MTFKSPTEMGKPCANHNWNPRLLLSRYRLLCLERLDRNVIHSSCESKQCGNMPYKIWPDATRDRALDMFFFRAHRPTPAMRDVLFLHSGH
jgi:hypothetical protein